MIVTGEAVALDVRPTSVAIRVVSGLIDALAYGLLYFLGITIIVEVAVRQWELPSPVSIITWTATCWVIIPLLVEGLTQGRSLGKFSTGTKIVRDDGGTIRWRHAAVRAVTGLIDLWLSLGSVATLSSIMSARGKRVGDRLAGTYSVPARGTDGMRLPLVMPAELLDWADIADLSGISDIDALSARDFLGRTATMSPATRQQAGRELAARLEQGVAPAPPWGTHPERFLAAALVARRDRDYRRAHIEQAKRDDQAARLLTLPHGIRDS